MVLQALTILAEEFEKAYRLLDAQATVPATVLSNLEGTLVQRIREELLDEPRSDEALEPSCSCTEEELALPGCCASPYCLRLIEPDEDIRKDDDILGRFIEDEGFTFADFVRKLPF